LTSSVGASTDRAVCSVCKEDWTVSDFCGHRPGQTYDGVDGYIIAGKFEYEELSMVNKPADRQAKVLSLSFNNSVNDQVIDNSTTSSRINEIQLEFLKEEDMPKNPTQVIQDSENTESFNDF